MNNLFRPEQRNMFTRNVSHSQSGFHLKPTHSQILDLENGDAAIFRPSSKKPVVDDQDQALVPISSAISPSEPVVAQADPTIEIPGVLPTTMSKSEGLGIDETKVLPSETVSETINTLGSILRAALAKNANSILARAIDFVGDPKLQNSRYHRLKKQQEDEDQLSRDTQLVLEYIASEDITFILNGLSTDIILEAMIRRTAWKKHFGVMVLMSIGQIAMCAIAILTVNSPMNLSTLAIAAVYIVCISTANPFNVTRDASAIIKKKILLVKSKVGLIGAVIAVFFAIPIIALVIVCTALFDFLVGRVIDNSYEGAINIIVNCIVVSTGVSVGLRSGGPVGAIQTFAGFSFIASVDEEFMSRFKFDPYETWVVPTRKEAKKIKFISRMFMYTLVPIIFVCVIYETLTNDCIVFCSQSDNSIQVQPF